MMARMSSAVRAGLISASLAAVPATNAHDIDVPLKGIERRVVALQLGTGEVGGILSKP
jgi:hypothetical protein